MRIEIEIDPRTYANMMRDAVYYRIDNIEEFIETKLEELYG
jgi:hypothetical protein